MAQRSPRGHRDSQTRPAPQSALSVLSALHRARHPRRRRQHPHLPHPPGQLSLGPATAPAPAAFSRRRRLPREPPPCSPRRAPVPALPPPAMARGPIGPILPLVPRASPSAPTPRNGPRAYRSYRSHRSYPSYPSVAEPVPVTLDAEAADTPAIVDDSGVPPAPPRLFAPLAAPATMRSEGGECVPVVLRAFALREVGALVWGLRRSALSPFQPQDPEPLQTSVPKGSGAWTSPSELATPLSHGTVREDPASRRWPARSLDGSEEATSQRARGSQEVPASAVTPGGGCGTTVVEVLIPRNTSDG